MIRLLLILILMCNTVSAAVDDEYTINLLHFDTDFTDESGATWSQYSEVNLATISSDQSVFGGASFLSTNQSYIISTDTENLGGASSFTIDLWVWWQGQSGNQRIFGDSNSKLALRKENSEKAAFYMFDGGSFARIVNSSGSLAYRDWMHVAVCKDGNTNSMYIFLDGILQDSASSTIVVPEITGNIGIGGAGDVEIFYGYIDELRVSKGICRWTSDFTPPTAPYSTTFFDGVINFATNGILRLSPGGKLFFRGN